MTLRRYRKEDCNTTLAQEPYFPLIQLEMMRLQVVESSLADTSNQGVSPCNIGTRGNYLHLDDAGRLMV